MNPACIPFNFPYMAGNELKYIQQAYANGRLAGDGPFTKQCHDWLEKRTGCRRALLTHSCTAALEMAAILLRLKPGDEVILPSYTFVSTANAFVLRGAVLVFVDIRKDTLNIDETLISAAITDRTRAIVVVHYAGVGCEMDVILGLARKYNLEVIEDAAQGIMARYKGRPLGSLGSLGTYSFHETKNLICGEGGALLVNDPRMISRAEIIREKGTDRSRFFRGEIDKYTWQDIGSSFLPGELTAAFLAGQLEEADNITHRRITIWNCYHELLAPLEKAGWLRRPIIPSHCEHNGHMYHVILNSKLSRNKVLELLRTDGILAVFHYVPLHSTAAGLHYGRASGTLSVTDWAAEHLIRLPMWINLTNSQLSRIVTSLTDAVHRVGCRPDSP